MKRKVSSTTGKHVLQRTLHDFETLLSGHHSSQHFPVQPKVRMSRRPGDVVASEGLSRCFNGAGYVSDFLVDRFAGTSVACIYFVLRHNHPLGEGYND